VGRVRISADQLRVTSTPRLPETITWRVPSIWFWPPLAVVALAIAGQFLGWLSAAVVFGATAATAAGLLASKIVARPTLPRTLMAALCAGGCLAALLAASAAPIHQGRSPDLSGERINSFELSRYDLRGANLAGARLDELDLRGRDLAGAWAPGASFVNAQLQGANLRGANLSGADFKNACMRGVDLDGAILAGANVEGADLVLGTLDPEITRVLVGRAVPVSPDRCRS
jgi:hypothetical protein